MNTQLTEINKLADDRLALQRQVFDLKAKLDASTKAYALLSSHRDSLADACQALQVVAVKCEYFGRGEPYHHLIEQARLALGGDK